MRENKSEETQAVQNRIPTALAVVEEDTIKDSAPRAQHLTAVSIPLMEATALQRSSEVLLPEVASPGRRSTCTLRLGTGLRIRPILSQRRASTHWFRKSNQSYPNNKPNCFFVLLFTFSLLVFFLFFSPFFPFFVRCFLSPFVPLIRCSFLYS